MPAERSIFRLRQRGFTLVELLIATAIGALLMAGVIGLLQVISSTITSGQALSAGVRGQRAIASSLEADLAGTPDHADGAMSLRDMPFLIITNMRVPAAANQQAFKRLTDLSLLPTSTENNTYLRGFSDVVRDVPADVTRPARKIPIYEYGTANFRVDTFSFFGKGSFRRQTGDANGAPLIDRDFKADYAWIWYGHLNVFAGNLANLHQASGYAAPGLPMPSENRVGVPTAGDPTTANRVNRTAEQFMLGRAAFLIRSPVEFAAANTIGVFNDRSPPAAQPFASTRYGVDLYGASLAPLASFTPIINLRVTGGVMEQRFLDRTLLADHAATDKFTPFDPTLGNLNRANAVYLQSFVTDVVGVNLAEYSSRILGAQLDLDLNLRWHRAFFASYDRYSVDPGDLASPVLSGRFWVNPFPATQLDAASLAQRAHLLHEGCSQFIVEFAGDFVTQDKSPSSGDYGKVRDNIPDGEIDFCVVDSQRQTKWYGLPRDVDEDGVVPTAANRGIAPWNTPDVQPARDMSAVATAHSFTSPGFTFPFEKALPPDPIDPTNYLSQLSEPPTFSVSVVDASGYSCAWGPLELRTAVGQIPDLLPALYPRGALPKTATGYYRPRMIRVLFDVTDPNNRLQRTLRLNETFALQP